jgi:hypothetical protein
MLDLNHFMREDDFLIADLIYTHPISNRFTIRFAGRYREQQTNLDPVPGFDRLDPSDFDNYVIGLQLNYYFSKKSKTERKKSD